MPDMSDQLWAALIGGVAGLASGALVSLVAPWVNWGVEKRRLRLMRRRELVDQWRAGLAEAESADVFGAEAIEHLVWYQSLRRHLDPWDGSTPADRTVVVTPTGSRSGTAVQIDNAIEKQARIWGIE
jgi:hypothetical protein